MITVFEIMLDGIDSLGCSVCVVYVYMCGEVWCGGVYICVCVVVCVCVYVSHYSLSA